MTVSIHAPRAVKRFSTCFGVSIRAGRDVAAIHGCLWLSSFNPRAPRGARLRWECTPFRRPRFQSTRPARGATSS